MPVYATAVTGAAAFANTKTAGESYKKFRAAGAEGR